MNVIALHHVPPDILRLSTSDHVLTCVLRQNLRATIAVLQVPADAAAER